jgi:hypothetical protein
VTVDADRLDEGISDASIDDATRSDAQSDAAIADASIPADAAPFRCGEGALDVLFVVDPSVSLTNTLPATALTSPAFFESLFSYPPLAPADMHIGVISTSLGLNGAVYAALNPSCAEHPFGDEAALQTASRGAGCAASHPAFLTYTSGDDVTVFASELTCALQLPTLGCSVEQPLEAALRALTPSTSPMRFAGGTTGQADLANAGFRRPGAALAIIVLSDEDDCSNDVADFFDPSAPYSPVETRCATDTALLQPISRYVDAYLALAPPERLAVVAVAGFPGGLDPTAFDSIRSDIGWRLEILGSTVTPICDHDLPRYGAAPAFRLLDVVEGIMTSGGYGGATSICSRSLRSASSSVASTLWCVP